jgi:hypothetical protein
LFLAELLVVAVNVVVSHPSQVVERAVDVVSAIANVGSVSFTLSPIFNGTFNANVNDIADGAALTSLSIVNTLCCTAGVITATSVDADAAIDDAVISSACAKVTAAVRKLSFPFPAVCASMLVVTPVTTLTSHIVPASIVAAAAVSVSVAVCVAEFVPPTLNVVVPHPLFVNAPDGSVPNVNVGSTSATLSFTFSGAVSSNAYEIDDSVSVVGLAIVSLLCVSTAFVTAGDTLIASAVMSVMPVAVLSRSTCTVRVGILAIWSAVLVVMPVATYTVHCLLAGSIATADFNVNAALFLAELRVVAVNVVVSHP